MKIFDYIHSGLGRRFLLKIFKGYFIFATLLTGFQLYLEFENIKKEIIEELKTFEITFGPSIAKSIWNLDREALSANMEGILFSNMVIGTKVFDHEGKQIFENGITNDDLKTEEDRIGTKLFSKKFPLKYMEEGGSELRNIGHIELFSSNNIVFGREKNIIFLIVLSSFFKTFFLWAIMLYYLKRDLTDNFLSITDQIVNQNPKIPTKIKLNENVEAEFIILADTFNKMVDEINTHNLDLEVKIKERTKELELALAAKSRFLARMSHELRTPLNGIVGCSHLLSNQESNPKFQEYINMILISSERLKNTINEVLDFSKIMEVGQTIEETSFELEEVFEIVFGTIRSTQFGIENKLIREIDLKIPKKIITDKNLLTRILINLMSNSNKFTKNGKIEVVVKFESTIVGEGSLNFKIKDNGVGIDKNYLENIFEPFSQEDETISRGFEGTGLGLAIVKELVLVLGGKISIESEKGKGTTVSFSIKVKYPQELKTLDKIEKIDLGNLSEKYPLNILVVDDNEINLITEVNLLKSLGYSPEMARNGKEAVDKTRQSKIDFILMDIHMPILNGFEATREILGSNGANHPMILAATGDTTEESLIEIKNAGMIDYLYKPFGKKELIEKIVKHGPRKIGRAS